MSLEDATQPKTERRPAKERFYVTGGTLKPNALSYVERQADGELWRLLAEGEYCYVLTSRQMGKSSLMARTAARLREESSRAAVVDLTQIGSERGKAAAEPWYYGVVRAVHRGMRLTTPLKPWWEEHADLSPVQRFVDVFREVALVETRDRLVVFVDEIDSTIGLPFAADFFAAIRACYNERANDTAFERLSFVLLGVATPDQLIDDQARTPFNVGRRLELSDFTLEEARQLAQGLPGEQADEVLARILHWTGGQPYLTQVLCRLASERELSNASGVDALVEQRFLSESAVREETHLRDIRSRLCGADEAARQRLSQYRRILRGRSIVDEPTSPDQAAMKLAGVVRVRQDGVLVPRNRLYQRVFNDSWARREMPRDRARQAVYGSLAAMAATFVVWYAAFQPQPHVRNLQLALDDYSVAANAYAELRKNPFASGRADELMASFWDRRALRAARLEGRDQALLNTLRALSSEETDLRRREVGQLMGADYSNLQSTMRHGGAVLAVAFSPDGNTVITGSSDGTARLWSARTGEPIGNTMQHQGSVNAVAFSPEGKTVITGSSDNTARLWSTNTGEPLGQPMHHQSRVQAVVFSPDGKIVATGSNDKTARLWNADTGKPSGQPMQHQLGVLALAFSPDGKTLFSGTRSAIEVWSATTGASLAKQHPLWGFVLAFSPGGKAFITGSLDGKASIWDTTTCDPIARAMQHQGPVRAAAFSSDGKTVITGNSDYTARLWDATTGEPIGQIIRHQSTVRSVAFRPDGKNVITGSSDDTARIWSATNGEAIGRIEKHHNTLGAKPLGHLGKSAKSESYDNTAKTRSAPAEELVPKPMQNQNSIL
ncbi:MAG: AAA-like domain-containing protein [Pseudomonadota bacterium]